MKMLGANAAAGMSMRLRRINTNTMMRLRRIIYAVRGEQMGTGCA
jgi:hypothetical protein